MPAIQTSGFNVGVMPQVNFADPRLVTPQYSNIIPALGQGLGLAEQVQSAPIRRQLAQIQLQQAEQAMALAPLQIKLEQARIAEAQQNAAVPRFVPQNITLEDQTKVYPAALDEAGLPTGEPDRAIGDLVQVEQGVEYGPGGEITPVVRRKTLKGAADRALEEQKVSDLSSYRSGINQINMLKAEAAKAKLDNPNYQKLGATVNSDGNVVYTLRNTKTGAVEQVDSGNAPIPTGLDAVAASILRGAPASGAIKPPSMIPVTQAGNAIAPIDAYTEELIRVAAKANTDLAAKDKFTAGQIYKDASGNRAEYLGNGQWREIH